MRSESPSNPWIYTKQQNQMLRYLQQLERESAALEIDATSKTGKRCFETWKARRTCLEKVWQSLEDFDSPTRNVLQRPCLALCFQEW